VRNTIGGGLANDMPKLARRTLHLLTIFPLHKVCSRQSLPAFALILGSLRLTPMRSTLAGPWQCLIKNIIHESLKPAPTPLTGL
jgi:hypothetical protein